MATSKRGGGPIRFVAWIRLKNGRILTAKELGLRGIPLRGGGPKPPPVRA